MRAIRTQPQNPALWYNLAVTQRQLASEICKNERPSIDEMRNAVKELTQVRRDVTLSLTLSLSLRRLCIDVSLAWLRRLLY
jgi:hypothetical protein